MPATKAYTRVNFENYPSTNTPLNATNLNKVDKGIDDLDDLLVTARNNIETLQSNATTDEANILALQGSVAALNGFTFYPAGEVNLVALVADDSFYKDANDKYVLADSATGQALIDGVTYKALASTEDCRGEVGADSVAPFSKKIEFTDFAVVGGKLSEADSMVTIPKTPNTIIDTVLTPSALDPHTYTFQPISTDTYFYVLNGTYASSSVAPTTINNISVTNGVIEQLGQSYTIVVRNQSGSNNSSVAYSLFRVKGDSSCRVTIPSSYSVVGIKLIQFTI